MVFVLLSLAGAPAALGDTAVLPDDGSLPWTDPSHQHPLEVVLSRIASQIAGFPVRVYCEGEYDWSKLHAPDAGGYVGITAWRWDGSRWNPQFENGGLAQLSPEACSYLAGFARTATKPTKCAPERTEMRTSYRTRRVAVVTRVRVRRRVVVNGRRVWRTVTVPRRAWRTVRVPVRTAVHVQGPPQPCFVDGQTVTAVDADPTYWREYGRYAWALLTVAHEASHLAGDVGVLIPAGYPLANQWAGVSDYEARAECHAMQRIAYVAEQLGDSPDDGEAIAQWYWSIVYPREEGQRFHDHAYWSADCRADGPLDLTAGDGVWP